MSTEINNPGVRKILASISNGDKEGLLTLAAQDIEWIIPGKNGLLAGTHCGHAGWANLFQKASEKIEMTYPSPHRYVAQGNRVLVVGVATGRIKSTNTTFDDDRVLDLTVRDEKVAYIRTEIIDLKSDRLPCQDNGKIATECPRSDRP